MLRCNVYFARRLKKQAGNRKTPLPQCSIPGAVPPLLVLIMF
jgi:hypothetical protein